MCCLIEESPVQVTTATRETSELEKTLVIGYGNPARGDDGLGPAFIEKLERKGIDQVETRVDYQLCVEDAMDMAHYDQVIFVDATRNHDQPFTFNEVDESQEPPGLDTHNLSPEAVTHLSRALFGSDAKAFTLAISGSHFDTFEEALSQGARLNLQAAFDYFLEKLCLP